MGARNVVAATGALSISLLGKQTRYGVPVDDFTDMIQRRFPGVRNNLDLNADFIQSESWLGTDAAPPEILGGLNPQGAWENEQLPEDIIHFLIWCMNIQTDPTNTPIANDEITAAGNVSGSAVSPTGNAAMAAWPGQVAFTFTGSNTAAANANIRVRGSLATGRTGATATEETISVNSGNISANTVILSNNFYRTISQYQLTGITGGMVQVEFRPNSNQSLLTLGSLDAGLVAYTVQMRKGPTLFVAPNTVVQDATITMADNVRIATNLFSSDLVANVLITDLFTPATDFPNSGDGALTNFPFSNLDFVRPRGTGVYLGTVGSQDLSTVDYTKPVTTDSVAITINNNLEEPTGNTDELAAPQPAVGGEGRVVSLSIGKRYETGEDSYDWQSIFRSSGNVPIVVRKYSTNSVGRLYLVEYRMPNCTFSDAPTIPVEGRGTINQTLNFNCSETSGGAAALVVQVTSKTGFSNGNGQ